ncbi:hypothetical protein MTO96_050652 [Rhipicephalus appendiculatus]
MAVLSDLQSAVRNYARGRIFPEALQILKKAGRQQFNSTVILWFPAHVTTPVNEGPSNSYEMAHFADWNGLIEFGSPGSKHARTLIQSYALRTASTKSETQLCVPKPRYKRWAEKRQQESKA